MISNKQPHTFKLAGTKFYAFFLNFAQVVEEEVVTVEIERNTAEFRQEALDEYRRKYEAGELDPSEIETRETTYTGFHFFLFDQDGYVWAQLTNTNDQSVESICGSLRGKRTYGAETDKVYHEPLPCDNWIENAPPDVSYALETFREAIGLNLLAFKQAMKGFEAQEVHLEKE